MLCLLSPPDLRGAGMTRVEGGAAQGSKLKAFRLLCQAEEWSPIKQRCLFPLPRILSKLPPEPLPFYPCHPTHPLNTLQGTVRVRPPEIWLCFPPVGVKDGDNSVRSVGRRISLFGKDDANSSELHGKLPNGV